LLSYLYVYLRGAAHPEWWGAGDWPSARQWFWAFVSTAQGRAELGWGFEPGRAFFGNQFPELIWVELSLPILLLSLVGVALLGRKLAGLIYSTLAIYLVFCWAYRYGNWYQVILPAYPLVLLGLAGVANWLSERQARRANMLGIRPETLELAMLAALIVAVLWRFQTSLPRANSHNRAEDTALAQAATLVVQQVPAGAKLFTAVDDALALAYLTQIWGIRPDLRVVSSPQAGELLRAGEPVFVTWQAAATLRAELPTDLHPALQSAGPDWIRFSTGPGSPSSGPEIAREIAITPGLALVGYTLAAAPAAQPEPASPLRALDVTLYWRVAKDWPADLALSIRPIIDGGYVPNPAEPGAILQQDRPRPAHGLLTLDGLPADTVVLDAYRFAGIQQVDSVRVILYRNTADGFINIAELDLAAP
jgi:hypothetical protein